MFDIVKLEEFYIETDKYSTSCRRIEQHNKNLSLQLYEVQNSINEGIIIPELINLKTLDINELNKQFVNNNIVFAKSEDDLNAYYDKKIDKIFVFFTNADTKREIEALIGHEMVHREQHIKSKGNYFKQSEKMINKLNKLQDERIQLLKSGGNLIHKDKITVLSNKMNTLLHEFRYLTPYEKMAYAYQYVKMYKNKKPNEIVNILLGYPENVRFPVTIEFKKYIAMYWLIRNKI